MWTLAVISMLSLSGHSFSQSYPPAWSVSGTYAVGDLVQKNGNTFKAIKAVTLAGPDPTTRYDYWQLNQVQSNTVLMIGAGQTFQTLNIAWTYAWNARIADGAYLHFYIDTAQANYTQNFPVPFLLDHASGARIAIIGDNPNKITLNFFGTNGFIIDTGHSINTLAGFTMTNSSTNSIGLKADGIASVSSVVNASFNGFGTCIQATQDSTVTVASDVSFLNFASRGADAESCGSIYFPEGAAVTGLGMLNGQTALYAAYGGEIIAEGSQISDCRVGAMGANEGNVDVAHSTIMTCNVAVQGTNDGAVEFSSSLEENCNFGAVANDRGFVDCTSSSFSGNSTYDLDAGLGGYVEATSATFTTSQQGGPTDGSYVAT
jgi:hypothetical protein